MFLRSFAICIVMYVLDNRKEDKAKHYLQWSCIEKRTNDAPYMFALFICATHTSNTMDQKKTIYTQRVDYYLKRAFYQSTMESNYYNISI